MSIFGSLFNKHKPSDGGKADLVKPLQDFKGWVERDIYHLNLWVSSFNDEVLDEEVRADRALSIIELVLKHKNNIKKDMKKTISRGEERVDNMIKQYPDPVKDYIREAEGLVNDIAKKEEDTFKELRSWKKQLRSIDKDERDKIISFEKDNFPAFNDYQKELTAALERIKKAESEVEDYISENSEEARTYELSLAEDIRLLDDENTNLLVLMDADVLVDIAEIADDKTRTRNKVYDIDFGKNNDMVVPMKVLDEVKGVTGGDPIVKYIEENANIVSQDSSVESFSSVFNTWLNYSRNGKSCLESSKPNQKCKNEFSETGEAKILSYVYEHQSESLIVILSNNNGDLERTVEELKNNGIFNDNVFLVNWHGKIEDKGRRAKRAA